jgi:hypothetical protein
MLIRISGLAHSMAERAPGGSVFVVDMTPNDLWPILLIPSVIFALFALYALWEF